MYKNLEYLQKIFNMNDEILLKAITNTLLQYKKGGTIKLGKSGIHIKEENKGKFTAAAKRAGKSVQEFARDVLKDPNATPLMKKRANFARNAKRFKH